MPRISAGNRVTIPAEALKQAGLHAGDEVIVEVVDAGELRLRRALTFEQAFAALTGAYPRRYLEDLDHQKAER